MPAILTVGIGRALLRRRNATSAPDVPTDLGEYNATNIAWKDADTLEKIVIKDNGNELEFYTPSGGETEVTEVIFGDGSRFARAYYSLGTIFIDSVAYGPDYYSTIKVNNETVGTSVWRYLRQFNTNTFQKVS